MTILIVTKGPWAEVLNEYENNLYGHDFAAPLECFEPWLNSNSFFCAVSVDDDSVDRPDKRVIHGVLSILVTKTSSVERLLMRQIREWELEPWAITDEIEIPSIYCSDLSTDHPAKTSGLYLAAKKFFNEYWTRNRRYRNLQAISIAATSFGENHLKKAGYARLSGTAYLGKYSFYAASCSHLVVPVWRKIMNCRD